MQNSATYIHCTVMAYFICGGTQVTYFLKVILISGKYWVICKKIAKTAGWGVCKIADLLQTLANF